MKAQSKYRRNLDTSVKPLQILNPSPGLITKGYLKTVNTATEIYRKMNTTVPIFPFKLSKHI